ncbi:hypothetical protein ACNHUS_13590 [Actinomycetes bacterium M1A6_2h]
MTVNVVYRKDPTVTPSHQYYSIPVSIVGGADSVPSARVAFREALSASLEVDETGLPPIAEHVEVEALPGIWVRMALDAQSEQRVDGLSMVTMLVTSQMKPDQVDFFWNATSASGDPVILIVQPWDTLGFVFDQMGPTDALWLAIRRGDQVHWLALFGGAAEGVRPDDMQSFDRIGPTRDMTIAEFAQGAMASEDPDTAQQILVSA